MEDSLNKGASPLAEPLASLSAACVIVLSGGCLWSFKFNIDVFVPWITNIMAATLLLCVLSQEFLSH